MLQLDRFAVAAVAIAALAVGSATAEAKECWKKAAEGTAGDEKGAKFQVDEAILQATDWGAWATWMASGTTPGYNFGKRTYKCSKGSGLGVTCRGSATICKI